MSETTNQSGGEGQGAEASEDLSGMLGGGEERVDNSSVDKANEGATGLAAWTSQLGGELKGDKEA
jgi:hypothetical protein